MKIKFSKNPAFSGPNAEENIQHLSKIKLEEIYFQFDPENTVLGYVNLRYSESLSSRTHKRGIDRKVILDKKISSVLKTGKFYKLFSLEVFVYSPTVLFVSGEIEDLTDKVRSNSFEVTRNLRWGITVTKRTQFVHPNQGDQTESKNFPEIFQGFQWSDADILWERRRAEKDIWIKRLREISSENVFVSGDEFEVYELENITQTGRSVLKWIDVETGIASLFPILKVQGIKHTFDMEKGISQEEVFSWEVYHSSHFSHRFDKVREMVETKTDLPVFMERIEERTSSHSIKYSVTKILTGDGWSRGLEITSEEKQSFEVIEEIYKVSGLPPEIRGEIPWGGSVLSNCPGQKEENSFFCDQNSEYIFVHKRRVFK